MELTQRSEVSMESQPVTLRADAGSEKLAAPVALAEEFSDARLLIGDTTLAFHLIDHARRRALVRAFGVSPDQANLLTLIVVLMLAEGAYARVQRLLRAPGVPSAGDGLLTTGALRELLCGVAGPAARDVPLLGTLLTIAVVGHTTRPAVMTTIRAIRAGSRRMTGGFHHRYGYLVDPGHRRERHARAAQSRHVDPARQAGTDG